MLVEVFGLYVLLASPFCAKVRNSSSLILEREIPMMRVGSENLVVALPVIERRQELAFGQVARASEDDEVERVDWNDLACHGLSA